jgi:membrane associated rhomboid family serine protease
MSLERRLGSFKYFLTLVALTLLSSAAYVALGKHTK